MLGKTGIGLLIATAALVAAPAANAADQWYDGQVQTSILENCFTFEDEYGAGAYVGQYADAAKLPRPGDVFFVHVIFEALTEADCGVEQHAEVDLVLPHGVSIAPDSKHPIACFYSDDGGATEPRKPTCPTHGVTGTYGRMLPPQNGGGAWDLPVGRTFELQVPLKSTRRLDVTGGPCQSTLTEVVSEPSDCLVGAVHVIDGQSDPWIVPHKQLFVQADNRFRFGRTHLNKHRGTAKLAVKVPGAGRVRLARSSTLRGSGATATNAQWVRLEVKPRGRTARKLWRKGRVKVDVEVTFRPIGGTALTKTKAVKLVEAGK